MAEPLTIGDREFWLEQEERSLVVQGHDLELERTAALLTGELPPWLLCLTVLERLIKEGGSLQALLHGATDGFGAEQVGLALDLAAVRGGAGPRPMRQWGFEERLRTAQVAPEMVEWLARSGSVAEKAQLAGNQNCPDSVRVELLRDGQVARMLVGIYRDLSPVADILERTGVLAVLAQDPASLVRAQVAKVIKDTEELWQLCCDSDLEVRLMAARNPHADQQMLTQLGRDRVASVAAAARSRLGLGRRLKLAAERMRVAMAEAARRTGGLGV